MWRREYEDWINFVRRGIIIGGCCDSGNIVDGIRNLKGERLKGWELFSNQPEISR